MNLLLHIRATHLVLNLPFVCFVLNNLLKFEGLRRLSRKKINLCAQWFAAQPILELIIRKLAHYFTHSSGTTRLKVIKECVSQMKKKYFSGWSVDHFRVNYKSASMIKVYSISIVDDTKKLR